jgi:hypothetical protein
MERIRRAIHSHDSRETNFRIWNTLLLYLARYVPNIIGRGVKKKNLVFFSPNFL